MNRRGRVRTAKRTETTLVTSVLDLLRVKGIMCWRQNTLPIPEIIRRTGREGLMQRGAVTALVRLRPAPVRGLADIAAIAPGGRSMQIECKLPGQRARPEQVAWLDEVAAHDGIAIVLDDLDELIGLLERCGKDTARWELLESPWGPGRHGPLRGWTGGKA